MYTVIPKESYSQFCKDNPKFICGPSTNYTDVTVKVLIEEKEKESNLPESPEEWERKRQRYLFATQSDGIKMRNPKRVILI